MASTSTSTTTITVILTVITLLAAINTVVITAVRETELTVMLSVLRARGYHLFANAITTSDLHHDLRSNNNNNFTLLAPINSALFALDMTMPATNYVTTLRYHVIPRRMSMIDLLSLSPDSNIVPTLVPGRDVRVEQRRSVRSLITVGGVDIVVPGLFYGRDVAVHGLGGIMEYRQHHSRNNRSSHSNSTVYDVTGNYTFRFPVAIDSTHSSHQSKNQSDNQTDRLWIEEEIDENVPNKRRGKLLEVEVRSDGMDSGLDASDSIEEVVREDDESIDCLLNDDVMNDDNDMRRLDVAGEMICAQK